MSEQQIVRLSPALWRALMDHLKKVLVDAQALRHLKGKWVVSNNPAEAGNKELEWMVYERQRMFDAVNIERANFGLPPVTMEQIVWAETLACGHCDYTSKFSLYCSELAINRIPRA